MSQCEIELLRAREAISRLLVTYGRRLEGDWYEFVAHESGLELDGIGMIRQPDSELKNRGDFKAKGFHAQ